MPKNSKRLTSVVHNEEKSKVMSMALIMIEVLIIRRSVKGLNDEAYCKMAQDQVWEEMSGYGYAVKTISIIKRMLHHDEKSRPNLREIVTKTGLNFKVAGEPTN